jgi:hypothetical protein
MRPKQIAREGLLVITSWLREGLTVTADHVSHRQPTHISARGHTEDYQMRHAFQGIHSVREANTNSNQGCRAAAQVTSIP